jgi:hypothetical protein
MSLSENERAQGRPDAGPAPMARLQKKSRRQSPQVRAEHRPSLRDGSTVYTYSPRGPAFLPPSSADHHRQLDLSTGRSGPHDFTVRIGSFVGMNESRCNPTCPPHPALNVCDDRETPLMRGGTAGQDHKFGKKEREIFLSKGLDKGQIKGERTCREMCGADTRGLGCRVCM